jgi:hypothetical protein
MIQTHYRTLKEGDFHFVLSNWLKSFRESLEAAPVQNDIYFIGQKNLILNLLATSNCKVACNPEEPDQVYAYLIYDEYEEGSKIPLIHFAYTKFNFRHLGIMKNLAKYCLEGFNTEKIIISHFTRTSDRLIEKYNLVFNPYVKLKERA